MLHMTRFNRSNEWSTACPFCSTKLEFYRYTTGACHRCRKFVPRYEKLPENVLRRIEFHKTWGKNEEEFTESVQTNT